ncbi:hypothetical protein OS493_027262 [Desmophyllum pertusum]|uniref:Uncharacterized protein n=1 Tax=Desmophyllum pertusum TaxID=174260 RepID=A0A9X0CW33_9CNID|nr:hypothetical protein OS493_027262 [Desmophyllum pertusum]
MPSTQIAAGNFLLCLSILLAGGSASKILQIFSHMGLGCITWHTFFRYQCDKLFTMILPTLEEVPREDDAECKGSW